MKNNNKSVMGIVLIIIAIVLVVGGVTLYNSVPSPTEINEVAKQASDEMNLDVATQDTAEPSDNSDPNTVESAAGTEEPVANEGEMIVKPGNPVVAKVDGKDITRVDVYRFIQTMPANMQQLPATTVYPMAMEQVINTRLVQNKADDADITDSEQFKAEMEIAKQQIARNLYLQQQVDAKITDAKMKKAYDDLMKQIPEVEERHARHILVETEDKAKEAITKLEGGADFAALAQELSVGPTAPKGGDLGYFAKTEMVPEFANAAFAMKEGDISKEPVQTQFGWHVIKLEDVRVRPKPTLDQVRPNIQAELRREILEDLLQDWRKDAKIEQFDINGEPLKKGANATGLVPPEETQTN